MPGGLARVATDSSVDVVSTQRGGGSKDIWVLPEAAAAAGGAGPREGSAGTLAVAPAPVGVPRTAVRQQQIPSRLVENLYWFGRYLVRCEDKARLLRGTISARIDEQVWDSALGYCRELGLVAPGSDPARSLRDDRLSQGIIADVRRLAWSASQVRARLSTGYWRAVAQMQHQLQEALKARDEPRVALDRLLLSLAALAGFALDDMTQDAGWRLLRIGRRIERLQFVCGLLAHHVSSDVATQQGHIEWLLEAYDSIRIYRARYVSAPRLGSMLDLLVRDAEQPRAIAFLSRMIDQDLAALAQSQGTMVEDALATRFTAPANDELLGLEEADATAARDVFAERLHALARSAGELSDRLSLRHFAHISFDSHAIAT